MYCPRNRSVLFTLCATLLLIALSGIIGPATSSAHPDKPHSVISPQSPLLFEENRGQFNEVIDYVARGKGYSVVLGQRPIIELYRYRSGPDRALAGFDESPQIPAEIEDIVKIQLKILGARKNIPATPLEKQQALTHYLSGEPSGWNTDIPNFKRVRYESLLDNIDVEYYGREGRLEYDFVIHPGGNPASIKLRFEGTQGVSIDGRGNLVIDLGAQEIVQRAPVSYQLSPNGERTTVRSSYTVNEGVVGFQVAAWDSAKTLVIDPVLEYSRYYGGAGSDRAHAADVDAADNIYIVGLSASTDLATLGAFQESNTAVRTELVSAPGRTPPHYQDRYQRTDYEIQPRRLQCTLVHLFQFGGQTAT